MRRGAAPDPRVLSVEWLDHRLAIFKSVTVPSVAAQTRRPDIWLVFLDDQTPVATRSALQQMTEALPLLRPIYCGVLDAAVYTDVIRRMAPAGRNWLVTTRLDNDDALHPSLLDAVQRAAAQRKREFINPQRGLIVASGLLYRKRDSSSPFISYSEPLAECRTVWMDQHQRLGCTAPFDNSSCRMPGCSTCTAATSPTKCVVGAPCRSKSTWRCCPRHCVNRCVLLAGGLMRQPTRSAWSSATPAASGGGCAASGQTGAANELAAYRQRAGNPE